MKLRNILSLALLLLFLSSCNEWLDVNPRQEMKESMLYNTEDGFKSTLIGAYLMMGESSLYGRNTTMYIPEMMAHHWTLPTSTGSTNYALGAFDYTYSGSESLFETTWKQYYKTIVHLNNLLGAFDTHEVAFFYGNDKMVKGEALGLRAFLHLDLLRYFGDVPAWADPQKKTIPYVTQMTKDPNVLVSTTWENVVLKIEKDLNDAEALLREVDPIVTGINTPDDEWHYLYRENRFNYYAVLGTKARFYQWVGDTEKAIAYAKMVIDATNSDGEPVFKLADESSYFGRSANLIMYNEILFGIHNSKLQSIVEPLFKVQSASYTQTVPNINVAYETGLHPDDIRNKERRYWEEKTYPNSATTNHFYKYIGNELGIATSNVVPLLRLSELYFILMENLPLEEAVPYFVKYRIARSMSSFVDETITSASAMKEQIEKEYRKEFFGEGQMFFYYKRLNYTEYSWPTAFTLPQNAYVVPLPKSQLSFE